MFPTNMGFQFCFTELRMNYLFRKNKNICIVQKYMQYHRFFGSLFRVIPILIYIILCWVFFILFLCILMLAKNTPKQNRNIYFCFYILTASIYYRNIYCAIGSIYCYYVISKLYIFFFYFENKDNKKINWIIEARDCILRKKYYVYSISPHDMTETHSEAWVNSWGATVSQSNLIRKFKGSVLPPAAVMYIPRSIYLFWNFHFGLCICTCIYTYVIHPRAMIHPIRSA